MDARIRPVGGTDFMRWVAPSEKDTAHGDARKAPVGCRRSVPRQLRAHRFRVTIALALLYPPAMVLQRRRPSDLIEPCQPSKVAIPPSGPLWVHEIKHDGYRLMVRRDGARVRCFTKGGHDWADRFPAIVDAALHLKATSFLIDGKAVIAHDDGTPDFHALRNRRRGGEVVLHAFDLLEHNGDDLRELPLIERKRRLAKLLGGTKQWRAIQFVEHLEDDGPTVYRHVCRMGLGASCRSARMRRTAADRRRRGSRRKTRRARRCAGRGRSGARHHEGRGQG